MRATLVKTVQPVLQTQPKLLATDATVQQDSQEMNVKFKITVLISRARMVEHVHPEQLPFPVNARATTRGRHVTRH